MHGFRMQGKNNTGINKNKKKKKNTALCIPGFLISFMA